MLGTYSSFALTLHLTFYFFRLFHRIPLLVSNLGMSEQLSYKTVSGSCMSVGFNRTIKTHRSAFFKEDGSLKEVQKINEMYASFQEELKSICIKVEQSEQAVEKLLKDVNRLKGEVKKRRQTQISTGEKIGQDVSQENVLLCQALRTFFPDSEFLHSCVISLKNRSISKSACNTKHQPGLADNLTLMVECPDIPEASPASSALLPAKRPAQDTIDRWQGKKCRLSATESRTSHTDTESSNQENTSATSSTEMDNELEGMGTGDSPTF